MLSLIKNMKEEARRNENMIALKAFKGVTGKDKEIYEKYKAIRHEQLDEVTKDLQQAFDSVAYEIRISKILQTELLNSEDKYKYLEDKIKSQLTVRKSQIHKKTRSTDSSETSLHRKTLSVDFSILESFSNEETGEKKESTSVFEETPHELSWREKLWNFFETNTYYYVNLIIQFLEMYTDIAEDENDDDDDFEEVDIDEDEEEDLDIKELNLKDSHVPENINEYEISEMKNETKVEEISSKKNSPRSSMRRSERSEPKSLSQNPFSFSFAKTKKNFTNLRDLFAKLFNKILLYYYCHTGRKKILFIQDVMCYFLFVVAVMINPTVFSMIFVVFAFSYASIQYPYPNQIYWIVVAFSAQFCVAVEYILKIIYKNQGIFTDTPVALNTGKYAIGNLFGWDDGESLLLEIGFYLLIVIFVKIHRDALTARGDW
jgi:hypothetical protein